MPLYKASRTEVIDELVQEVLLHYSRGRVLVAVDGIEGAGKTRFAAELVRRFAKAGHAAFQASIEDFAKVREENPILARDVFVSDEEARAAGREYYEQSFDYALFRRVLVEPFRMGGSTAFVTRAFDRTANRLVEPKWITGPADAVLVVDGVFLHRPELVGLWHYSIWLEAEPEVAYRRLAEREGRDADPAAPGNASLRDGMARYLAHLDPRKRATAVVDNNDWDAPIRRFADSC